MSDLFGNHIVGFPTTVTRGLIFSLLHTGYTKSNIGLNECQNNNIIIIMKTKNLLFVNIKT